METLERILGEHPFFAGFSPEHLRIVTGCARNTGSTPANTWSAKATRPTSSS